MYNERILVSELSTSKYVNRNIDDNKGFNFSEFKSELEFEVLMESTIEDELNSYGSSIIHPAIMDIFKLDNVKRDCRHHYCLDCHRCPL